MKFWTLQHITVFLTPHTIPNLRSAVADRMPLLSRTHRARRRQPQTPEDNTVVTAAVGWEQMTNSSLYKSHPAPEPSLRAPVGSSALVEVSGGPHFYVWGWSLQLAKENTQPLAVKVTSLYTS